MNLVRLWEIRIFVVVVVVGVLNCTPCLINVEKMIDIDDEDDDD